MTLSETYGLFRGRFQPFHKGHLERCTYILERHRILVIGIVIVKPNIKIEETQSWLETSVKLSIVDSFQSKKNPFSFIDTSNIILGSFSELGVDLNRIRIIPHFTPLVYSSDMEVLFTPPQNDTILYIVPSGDHNVFGIDYYSTRGWKVEIPPKINYTFSATEIRNKLENGEDISDYLSNYATSYLNKIKI